MSFVGFITLFKHGLIPSFYIELQEAVPEDNIDLLLQNLEQSNGLSLQNEDCSGSERRTVLHVEHR